MQSANEETLRGLLRHLVNTRKLYPHQAIEVFPPPAFYIPPQDVQRDALEEGSNGSFCEWKGAARYGSVRAGNHLPANAWSYPARMVCIVGDEQAHPQPGGFYGGWVTSDAVGPFKGTPGTEWW